MKYYKEILLSFFLMVVGASISIFFAVMGLYTYVRDELVEPSHWGSGGSPFDVVPYGVISFIFGVVLFIIYFIKLTKTNHR